MAFEVGGTGSNLDNILIELLQRNSGTSTGSGGGDASLVPWANIVDVPDLALRSEIPSLQDYAKINWVEQTFLRQGALDNYLTKTDAEQTYIKKGSAYIGKTPVLTAAAQQDLEGINHIFLDNTNVGEHFIGRKGNYGDGGGVGLLFKNDSVEGDFIGFYRWGTGGGNILRYVGVHDSIIIERKTVINNTLKIGDAIFAQDGNKLIITNAVSGQLMHLCTSGDVVAFGAEQGSEPTGAQYLRDLLDVSVSGQTIGQALVWNGSEWVNGTAGLDTSAVNNLINSKNFATQSWVNSQGFLTQHQSLAGYATESWVVDNYQPKGNYLTQHQTLNSLTLRYGESTSNYSPKIGADIMLPMFCLQGNLNYTDGSEVKKEEDYYDWECKNVDLLSPSTDLGHDNGFIPLKHGMYRYFNWYTKGDGTRAISSGRALLNFFLTGVSGTSLEVSWSYEGSTPLKFRRTIDADGGNRRMSHLWRAIIDESNIGTYMADKTAGYANALVSTEDAKYVHKAGSETISGIKRFTNLAIFATDGVDVSDAQDLLFVKNAGAIQAATTYKNDFHEMAVGVDQVGGFVWNRSNSPLNFATNGSVKMTILGDGKVGIGNINPDCKLDVNGDARFLQKIVVSNNEGYQAFLQYDSINEYNSRYVWMGADSHQPFIADSVSGNVWLSDWGFQFDKKNKALIFPDNSRVYRDSENNAWRFDGNIIATGDIIAFGGAGTLDIEALKVTSVEASGNVTVNGALKMNNLIVGSGSTNTIYSFGEMEIYHGTTLTAKMFNGSMYFSAIRVGNMNPFAVTELDMKTDATGTYLIVNGYEFKAVN